MIIFQGKRYMKTNFEDALIGQLVRDGHTNSFIGLKDTTNLKGKFHLEHFDAKGNLKQRIELPNGITNVGKNHALDVIFAAATQVATWYIGLIDNSGFTALAAADTMGSHAGWNEFTTYSEATRQEWDEDAAASQSITNSSPVTFSINGSGTVKGIFVTSGSAKSGTTGTLWSTGLFSSNIAVVNGDSLKITYTVNAA
jgi:hypothetical protein